MAWPKGQPAPNRGIPHTEETKEKISESCKSAGIGKWNLGIVRNEVRKNISEGQRQYFQTPEGKERAKVQGIRLKEWHHMNNKER
jgi:hypothetical protein